MNYEFDISVFPLEELFSTELLSDIVCHLEQVSALFSCQSCSQACSCSHCIALERLGLNPGDHILSVQDREVLPYFVTIFIQLSEWVPKLHGFLQSTFELF